FNMVKVDVARIWNTWNPAAIHSGRFNVIEQSRFQPITKFRNSRNAAIRKPASCNFCGKTKTNDARQILRTCPPLTLVVPAEKQRFNQCSPPNIHRSCPLRAMELVSRNREQIAADPGDVDRNLPRSLNSIGMEINISFSSNPPNLLDGL